MNLDSLEQLLDEDIPDSVRFFIYGQVIWPKTRNNPEEALRLTDSLMAFSKERDHIHGILSAHYYYGTTYKNQGQFADALTSFQHFYDHFLEKNDTVQITNVLYQMAVINQSIGNYTESMAQYNQCIIYDRILERQGSLATTITARAGLFKLTNQFDKALEDHQEALAIYKTNGDDYGLGRSLMNIGNAYGDFGEYDKALLYHDSTKVIADRLDYKYLQGAVHGSRANILTRLERYDEALDDYIRSLNIRKEMDRSQDIVKIQNKIAHLYYLKDDYNRALTYAKMSLAQGEEHQVLPEIQNSYKIIADSYKGLGKYRESLLHLEEYISTKDSILDNDITNQLAEMDAKYESSLSHQEIQRLSFESELQNIKLNQQKWALGITILIVGIMAILLYNLVNQKKQIQRQRNQIKHSLTEKEFLLKEIHHRVKNNLQVISSLLKLQSQSITDQKAQRALDEGRNRVRSMAIIHQNLYQKDNLSGIEMKEYLKQLTEELFDSYKVNRDRISLNMSVDDIFLDVDSAVPVGLIVNELVSNSLKHAFPGEQSGEIEILLTYSVDSLNLKVSDNGVGFIKEQVSSNSFGHELVAAFAERLQADYNLDGTQGTVASFRIRDFKLAA